MSRAIPTEIPARMRAGETFTFRLSLLDYPAPDWTLSYSFRAPGNSSPIDFTATPDGVNHLVEVAYADTAGWLPGIYTGAAYVESNGQKFCIWSGRLTVLPDIAGAEAGKDFRSQARRTLDNINAVLEKRASSTILNSAVEGTTLGRIPHADLLLLRDRFAAIVAQEEAAERAAQGMPNRRNIYTRFGLPR